MPVNIAKYRKMKELGEENFDITKLVGYYPDVSHSHLVKALSLNGITNHREVPSRYCKIDKNFKTDENQLKVTIEKDLADGLIPFFFMGVIGSTPVGGSDDVEKIAQICQEYSLYSMIDGAYSGTFGICSEFSELFKGLDKIDAYIINPCKTMLSGLNTTILYANNRKEFKESLKLDEKYTINDLRLGDFNGLGILQLDAVLQNYGYEGIKIDFGR